MSTDPNKPAEVLQPVEEVLRQEHRLEGVLSRGLIAGVALAALVTVVGGVVFLFRHSRDIVAYGTYHPQPDGLRSVGAVLRGVLEGDARAILQLGVVLLVATPIARVLFSLMVFAVQRDRLYVIVSAIVLALLMLGFLGITH